MLKVIMVPLDGSELSERALPYAQFLAHADGAKLLLARAVAGVSFAPSVQPSNAELWAEADAYLTRFVDDARAAGVVAEALVLSGEAGPALLQAIAARHPDLLVMSTHGRSGLGRAVWGSVADKLLHESVAPVLMVPSNVHATWAAVGSTRLVVPLDGSKLAEEALPPAEEMARALHAEIVLVQAIEPDAWLLGNADPWMTYEPSFSNFLRQETQAARQYLDEMAARLTAIGIESSVVTGDLRRAASVIRKAVRDKQAQAIVIATHGRGGPSRFFMGSVADEIVRTAQVPVLVVRPTAADQQKSLEGPATTAGNATNEVQLSGRERTVLCAALAHSLSDSIAAPNPEQSLALLKRLRAPAAQNGADCAQPPPQNQGAPTQVDQRVADQAGHGGAIRHSTRYR